MVAQLSGATWQECIMIADEHELRALEPLGRL
jgi:hypothetical protein